MEPSYSVVADALSKFHTAPEGIQALWLVMVPVTVLGAAFCLLQAVKEIVAMFARPGERRGVPLYVLYEDADGRLMLYARGTLRALQREEAEAMPLLKSHQKR
jgi:hypothetical protein